MSRFDLVFKYGFILFLSYLILFGFMIKSDAAERSTEPVIAIIYSEADNDAHVATEADKKPVKHVIEGCSLDPELQETIYKMCENQGIAFEFVMALIAVETGETWKTHLISKTNDYGLMQINRSNHNRLKKALGVTDFLDPVQNVSAGLYMLKELFDKYEDPRLVLMAYNMGEGTAKRLWRKGTYSSKYSRRVISMMEKMTILTI